MTPQRITRVVPRLLITGGRNWVDEWTMTRALATAFHDLGDKPVLVHGAARGADVMAARIWRSHRLPVESHPADWSKGKAAGFVRNQEMVDLGADLALAFPDPQSRGTWDCVRRIELAGIELRIFNPAVIG